MGLPVELTGAVSTFLDTVSSDSLLFRPPTQQIVSLLKSKTCVLLDVIEAAGQQLVDTNPLVRSKSLALIRYVLQGAADDSVDFMAKEGKPSCLSSSRKM